jgi:cytochrome c-type biogenesis protein CcmF
MNVFLTDLGQFALLLAFGLSCYALVGSLLAGRFGHRRLAATGERAAVAVTALVTIAVMSLWYQLVSSNFQLQYVASSSNQAMPWYYKAGALWGGQEGSLLFWCWILTLFSMVTVLVHRKRNPVLMPYVVGVVAMVTTFFLLVNNFVANPFDAIGVSQAGEAPVPWTPPDGQGLNPLLQYWAMVIHPPILYVGYVGFTIPFAFAIAALITRELDEDWIRTTRRWMMIPWLFLGTGVLLGAMWAYVVLGWGGYWGWDPVENASLMPWLTGTAFLHSVIMQERKGMMKVWNMVLILATFLLCILGTFLTRSGIVSSVHSFAQSPIGPFFSSFLVLMTALSLYFLLNRLDELKSENRLDSVVSRESSFLFNNLVLLATTFAVLWGTIFPILSEWITDEKRTVGAPFFNKVNIPIGLFLLLLTGIGPLLAWRKTSLRSLKKNFSIPLGAGLGAGAVFVALGMRHFYSTVCLILCVFVLVTILAEFHRGARARRRQGQSYAHALWTLTFRNTRRYGGYIVHVAMVFIFVGFAGAGFDKEAQQSMLPGDMLAIGNYRLELKRVESADNPNYSSATAHMQVWKQGKALSEIAPEQRLFKSSRQPTSEVALHRTLKEDLYVVFAGPDQDGTRFIIHVYIKPLVAWIWIGGAIFILGTVICLIPNRHERASQKIPLNVEAKSYVKV